MSTTDQISDAISSATSSLGRQFSHLADAIDKNVDFVADQLRDQLQRAEWLPDTLRPLVGYAPPPPPPPSASTYERVCSWVLRHRLLTGVLVLATGTTAYRTYRKSLPKRRRARREAKTGARVEVVVLVGNVAQPLTREIALDLEAKGFIVFVQVNNAEEEAVVQTLASSRPDIRALSIDMRDASSSSRAVERFSAFLQQQHSPGPRIRSSKLTLTGLVLIPSLDYTTAPIATIPPSSFEDIFETHLLQPIRAIQAFLPLLTASPHTSNTAVAVRRSAKPTDFYTPPKVLVLTPGIISSINPPWHVSEATVCAALAAFSDVLAGELRPLGNQVTQIRLGSFYDFARVAPGAPNGRATAATPTTTTTPTAATTPRSNSGVPTPLEWPEPARHVYGRNFASSQDAGAPGRMLTTLSRGWSTSPRQLYAAVFDVLDGSNTNSTVYVGLGAGTYGFVGRFVPRSLVAWMMGIRAVGIEGRSGTASPHYYAPGSGKQASEPINAKVMAAMEPNGRGPHESFVAVDAHHVWNEA